MVVFVGMVFRGRKEEPPGHSKMNFEIGDRGSR
jgi:hypothetical protein